VYISSGNGAVSNRTYALNATTGVTLWSVNLEGVMALRLPSLTVWCISAQ